MDGVQRIKGSIKFFMNGELVRVKLYISPKTRQELIDAWLKEISRIVDENDFAYVIVPEISSNSEYMRDYRKRRADFKLRYAA
jgi:hypothetical protein